MQTQIKNKSVVDLTETPVGRSAINSQWEKGNLIGNRSNHIITNDDANSNTNVEKVGIRYCYSETK